MRRFLARRAVWEVVWLGLMILVSPFLQLLTTLFGAHVTWWAMVRKSAPCGQAMAGRA